MLKVYHCIAQSCKFMFILVKDFGFFHGSWRTCSALFAELQDHMFIRRIQAYQDGNEWYMEVATVSDDKIYQFSHPSEIGLVEVFVDSQIGRKVLFQVSHNRELLNFPSNNYYFVGSFISKLNRCQTSSRWSNYQCP